MDLKISTNPQINVILHEEFSVDFVHYCFIGHITYSLVLLNPVKEKDVYLTL